MNYIKPTSDASYLYRPTSASDTGQYTGTAVNANLADLMKNTSIVRVTFSRPIWTDINNPLSDSQMSTPTMPFFLQESP